MTHQFNNNKPPAPTMRPARLKPQSTPVPRFARKAQTTMAGPIRISSLSMRESYNPGKDLLAEPARAGADDALAIPSRINNTLHYRDGRVVQVNHGDSE